MNYEPPKLTLENRNDEPVFNPWEIVEPFIKNRWFIALIIIVCLGLGFLYNINATPIYEAQSSVIIRRTGSESPLRETRINLPDTLMTIADFNTKVKLVNSIEFAEKVVSRLIEKGHFETVLKNSKYSELEPAKQQLIVRRLAIRLQGNIKVQNPRNTNIVSISFQNDDRRLARDVVNELADLVVEYNQEEKKIIANSNLAFLEDKLEESRRNVEKTERDLYEYRKKHGIVGDSNDADSFRTRRNQQIGRLNTIQENIRDLESQVSQLDIIIQSRDFIKYTAVSKENGTLVVLSSQLVQAEIDLKTLLSKYQDRYPEVIQAREKVEILKAAFNEELIKTRAKLIYDLNVLKSRETFLQKVMDDEMQEAVSGTERDIEYVILSNAAESERSMFDTLLQAVKEVSIHTNITQENVIYVHEKALLPERPIKPNKQLNLLVSLLIGLALGAAFAFGREYLDFTIRNPEDVRKATQLPVLTTVPLYFPQEAGEPGERHHELYIKHHPKSLFSESIASLRTHLNIKLPHERPVVLAITSSAPKEGKSLIASNLACSMALDGRRTLLIDADLHRPTIHKAFNMDKKFGLFDLIVDALNPRWSDLDLRTMNFGDLRYLIRLKQWSGTMKIQWDSLPIPLTISYQEGKPISSNIKSWKEKFLRPEGGFPNPVDPVFELDESDVAEYDSADGSGISAQDFINQYPRLRNAAYFHEHIIRQYLKDTPVENLHVLTAGTNPKNPSEILSSDQMATLLAILKQRYDRIILDCPPAWPLSDVSVLSPQIDGLIWICRAGETPKSVMGRNVAQIRQIQPNILGAVINAVDLRRDRYYYYGYSYYYYRYYKSHYSKDYGIDMGDEKKTKSPAPRGGRK